MCNDYGNNIPYSHYVEEFRDLGPVTFVPERPNLEPRDEIWPSEKAPIIRKTAHGLEFVQRRWGLGQRLGAPPIINMRSEGKAFKNHRCLIPASHYFEFTGKKSPKTRWKFTRAHEEWFCFAGIEGKAYVKEGDVEAFSMLTTEPGPDTMPYHNREPVIVDRKHWFDWLDGDDTTQVLQSSHLGSLIVTECPRARTGRTAKS